MTNKVNKSAPSFQEAINDGKVISIVLAGVGGQGTLIAGKLLGILAQNLDLDVKVSEVHGMSQRGGAVITYVRMGKKVYSPIVEEGMADYCLCFESLEALRWANLLKESGTMIISSQQINPLPVLINQAKYPENIEEQLCSRRKNECNILQVDALSAAQKSGSARATNMVMLGALSTFMGASDDLWMKAIKEAFSSKPGTIPMNLDAFKRGQDLAR